MNVEQRAIHHLLDKGEPVKIPAPFVLRLFGRKTITVSLHQPVASTCIRAIEKRLSIGVADADFEAMTIDQSMRLMVDHGMTVARMVATVLLRTESCDRRWGKWLAKFLLDNVPFSWLCDTMHRVTLDSGLEDFILTIRLSAILNLTNPNNQSHETEGS